MEPYSVSGYAGRASAYWYAGRYPEAVSDYTRVIQSNPDPVGYDPYNGRGQVYAEMGEYQKAIEDLNRAIELADDSDTEAYVRNGKGLAYAGLKRYPEALKEFELSIKGSPQNVWVYYNRATAYEWMGQLDNAIADFKKSLELTSPRLNPVKKEKAITRLCELGVLNS